MSIPVECKETQDFTPDCLKEAMGDDAPVFRLKPPSERCVRRFRQLVGDDGLEFYTAPQFNAEKLKAIDIYWSEDLAKTYKAKFGELLEKQKQDIALTDEEIAWAQSLDDELFDLHRPLNVMQRKTGEFQQYSPRHALAVYLAGWNGFDVPFRIEGGIIPADTITALEKALNKLGKAHSPDTPSLPFLELYFAVGKLLRLDEDEEKNSPAPSPSSTNPDASTAAAQTDGESIAESAAVAPSSSNSKKTTARKGA